MTAHWFPGHMAKAIANIKAVQSQIDLVIEVVDARLPDHTRNPIIDKLFPTKPRLILLNKEDLADPRATAKWIQYYKSKGHLAISINGQAASGKKAMLTAIKASKPADAKQYSFIVNLPTKAIVVGIPNVGKSTIINHLIGKNKAKTANKAGVTKSQSWLQGETDLMLMDTPGILWPRFEDPKTSILLACINCLPDVIIENQSQAIFICEFLQEKYPGTIDKHFGLDGTLTTTDDIFRAIAMKRGYLSGTDEIDDVRLYFTFIREFHTGKMGRFTLSWPAAN